MILLINGLLIMHQGRKDIQWGSLRKKRKMKMMVLIIFTNNIIMIIKNEKNLNFYNYMIFVLKILIFKV